MKKIINTISLLTLAMMLTLSMTITVFADASVTYKGQAEKFIFAPGSEYSPTDLFGEYKNVMPGDILTQQITVKNDASNDVKVKIYLRALGATDLQTSEDGIAKASTRESKDFLEHLELTVVQDGDSVLFKAPADQSSQLSDWVCLGTFYSGADIDLTVTLNVPIEIGNDCQNKIGALDWEFMVQEFPVEDDDPAAKTGDNMNLIIPIVIMIAAITIVAVILVRRRRRED